jgi:hypothetical protein
MNNENIEPVNSSIESDNENEYSGFWNDDFIFVSQNTEAVFTGEYKNKVIQSSNPVEANFNYLENGDIPE